MSAPNVVDPHQHFWLEDALGEQSWRSPNHTVLARSFEPPDLEPGLASVGVDATVVIQSMDNAEENRRLAAFAERAGFVAGVVGWLPLSEPARAGAELDALGRLESLRGVRCGIGRDPLDWLTAIGPTAVFRRLSERGLCWDVVPVTADQVRNVAALADRVGDLTVVIDHLARPPLDSGGWEPWATHLRQLARAPNVVVKLSVGVDVLSAWDRWQSAALAPYVEHALDCFGPARCMIASNWPVVLLHQDYATAWYDMEDAVRATGLSEAELAQVRGVTAERVYALARRGTTMCPALA